MAFLGGRLQAARTSKQACLLLYDTKARHAGGRPLSKIIEDVSLELAFLLGNSGWTSELEVSSW